MEKGDGNAKIKKKSLQKSLLHSLEVKRTQVSPTCRNLATEKRPHIEKQFIDLLVSTPIVLSWVAV